MNPCLTPKKRAPRRSSVLFCSLSVGTLFWLPGRRNPGEKTSVVRYFDFDGNRKFINPFRSVFVEAPKHVVPESELGRLMREDSEKIQEAVSQAVDKGSPWVALLDSGKTHFIGDRCPGGHADVAADLAQPAEAQPTTHCVEMAATQPNNDNNITGPTS